MWEGACSTSGLGSVACNPGRGGLGLLVLKPPRVAHSVRQHQRRPGLHHLPCSVHIPEHAGVFFSFTPSKAIPPGFCWPTPFPCLTQSPGGGQELTPLFNFGRQITRVTQTSPECPPSLWPLYYL